MGLPLFPQSLITYSPPHGKGRPRLVEVLSVMQRKALLGRSAVAGALALVVLAAAAAWWQRDGIAAWYAVRGLARASGNDQATWVNRVRAVGPAAVGPLVDRLQQADESVCKNVAAGLDALADQWGENDPRTEDLCGRVIHAFARLSAPGQRCIVDLQAERLRRLVGRASVPDSTVHCTAQILGLAADSAEADTRAAGLQLAEAALAWSSQGELREAVRQMVRDSLTEQDAPRRARAARLAVRPGMDLGDAVVGLLRDPSTEIRRLAIVSVGSEPQILSTDDLLAWLHDPDPEVRRLCEESLRSRGLGDAQLKLARLKSAPDPSTRLQVLPLLGDMVEANAAVWLRSLSHDPCPAVRAAAVRAAAEQSPVELRDRLQQMAQNDPSPTIQQMARDYLAHRSSGGTTR